MEEDAANLFICVLSNNENKLSILDCRMILHWLSDRRNPDWELIYRVLHAFEEYGDEKLNKETYDAVHRCLTIAGGFNDAVGAMNMMEEAGFSELVFGLCKAGTLVRACGVFG
ncbi:hypothetical protein SUGI_0093900 [Cryptomeria japonica]|nr:hypothetical protein SUGI_0093900 [Cryptomeria japonica]